MIRYVEPLLLLLLHNGDITIMRKNCVLGFSDVHRCIRLSLSASRSLWTWYLINHLGEFHQLYNFGAKMGTKMNWLNF